MSQPQSGQSVKVDTKGPAAPAAGTAPAGAAGAGAGGAGAPGAAAPTPHQGPGRVKRTARSVKQGFLVVIGALIAIFAVTNTDPVSVNWIFGETASTPLILVIAIALAAGLIIGWLVAKLGNRHAD